jgi:uncharacterized protein
MPTSVVMQPTTLCNLNCSYCYLPARRADLRMPVEVASAVAVAVRAWRSPVDVIWHGGEPLAAGREHLGALLDQFAPDVRHHVQTNATLIDPDWCAFLAEREIRVGISIDGPAAANGARKSWTGQPAHERIVRGIDQLRAAGIDFSAIAVVSDPRPGTATELYDFIAELGCAVLGINFEETEGINTRSNTRDPAVVAAFWAELALAWRQRPVLKVRELERVLGYVAAEYENRADTFLPAALDPFPTVAHNGDVVLFSPELAGFTDAAGQPFAAGNVLTDDLTDLVSRATEQSWVREFRSGVERCRAACEYFAFCGGGQAANRFFEHRRFDITRTAHCQNSRISLMEGVLTHAAAE